MKFAIAAIIALAAVGASNQSSAPPADESRSVWDGVYTDEQAQRGEPLYSRECASCHGSTLGGGESSPPLAGGEFLSNWNGLTAGDLFERIRQSMPQNNPAKVGRQQKVDILAYIFSVNKFPAGKTELEQATERLKQIRIEATKPKNNPDSNSGSQNNQATPGDH